MLVPRRRTVLVEPRRLQYCPWVIRENGASLLYEQLADALEVMIDAMSPGQRLPSVRRLAKQHRVSVATVVQAYVVLESRGRVEARPQSGHYVRPRPQPSLPEPRVARAVSAPSRVSNAELVERVYGAVRDPRVVRLGAVAPDPALLPTERLNRILGQVARTAGGAGIGYDPPPGLLGLRRAVARRAAEWGLGLRPDELITTMGCMEALHLCLRAVVKAQDAVAVETPTYFGLLELLESLELKVLEIPAHPRTGMDVDVLERALKEVPLRACICTPNFSNPTGSLMPDEAKEKLVLLLARAGVPLIEDDIYGDLHFGEGRPRPAKAFDRQGLVMLVGSFSKTLAPGYRVGFAAPGRFHDRVQRLKFAQTISTATLPQMAVTELLESGGYERHLRQLRRKIAENVERVTEAVAASFPPGTRASRPLGGMSIWLEMPSAVNALDLHAAALEEGISIAPGPIFSAKMRHLSSVRLNCGALWSPEVERAIARLGELAGARAARSARG